jgi:hypothetical protein
VGVQALFHELVPHVHLGIAFLDAKLREVSVVMLAGDVIVAIRLLPL